MAAYITTGWGRKVALSPKIKIFPNAWVEIEKECEALEAKLERMRVYEWRGKLYRAPMTDEAREVIKKLSRLDALQREILMDANPEYRDYWYGSEN